MRPAGEIRAAAREAAREAAEAHERRLVTWRDVAARLVPQGVGRAAVKFVVKNMAQAGELVPVDLVPVDGVSRKLRAYRPRGMTDPTDTAAELGALCHELFGPAQR